MTDKGKILSFPDTAAIEAEAVAWVARFDAGEVSAQEQAAFQEWLNRSPFHRDAIAEYGSLWSEFDTLRTLTTTVKTGPATMERTAPWLAACAAAVIAALGGVAIFHPIPQQVAKVGLPLPARVLPASYTYETAIGGQKKITLADGTSVILNTNSQLGVDFSGNRRDVHLMRGEAYFEVVHNKVRPFTVYASNYMVRDVGTAFDVHLSKAGLVEVGVTKGSVEVKPANNTDGSGQVKSLEVVTAGHDIVLGQQTEHAEPMANVDLKRKLAWRQGQLIYTGQPLGEVLADISRYSNIKIELADPELGSLPVGGAFRIDQLEAIFTALENNFGVHAQWINPQHVRFTAGHEPTVSKE